MTREADGTFANKTQNFEAMAQYQFDFGLRPSLSYVQSKGKDLAAVVPSLAATKICRNMLKSVRTTTSTKTSTSMLTTS
jgi:predicted porin